MTHGSAGACVSNNMNYYDSWVSWGMVVSSVSNNMNNYDSWVSWGIIGSSVSNNMNNYDSWVSWGIIGSSVSNNMNDYESWVSDDLFVSIKWLPLIVITCYLSSKKHYLYQRHFTVNRIPSNKYMWNSIPNFVLKTQCGSTVNKMPVVVFLSQCV